MAVEKIALPSTHNVSCEADNPPTTQNFDITTAKSHHNPLAYTYQKGAEHFSLESTYAFLRFNEFVTNTCLILNRRLTPGFAKNGRVQLVGVDWRLLDKFLCQFPSCKKSFRRFYPVVDRKKTETIYYYYDFSKIPDIGVKDWWIVRHYPNDQFDNYSESFYTKLKFCVCSTTNRVWVDYWQVTTTAEGLRTA